MAPSYYTYYQNSEMLFGYDMRTLDEDFYAYDLTFMVIFLLNNNQIINGNPKYWFCSLEGITLNTKHMCRLDVFMIQKHLLWYFYQNGWLIEKGKYQPEFLSCINHNIIFSQDALNTSYNGNLIVWGLHHGKFVQHI